MANDTNRLAGALTGGAVFISGALLRVANDDGYPRRRKLPIAGFA